ncbi:MAG: hypothetical protein Q4F13_10425 [Pseudomonadota bacterium]|nr:hypothetical protein [Pseudomonadota bacterium]
MLVGCAHRSDASEAERFVVAFQQLLPLPALMAHSATQDPRWPLGEKAELLSARQLGCVRQALSPEQISAVQRQLALDYVQAHPHTLADDLQVLEGGAAHLVGQAMRAGAGLAVDASPPTSEQALALAAFATAPRFAPLRQATGLSRLAGNASDPATPRQRGQDIAHALTVHFLTDAFVRCHIPVKLLY